MLNLKKLKQSELLFLVAVLAVRILAKCCVHLCNVLCRPILISFLFHHILYFTCDLPLDLLVDSVVVFKF